MPERTGTQIFLTAKPAFFLLRCNNTCQSQKRRGWRWDRVDSGPVLPLEITMACLRKFRSSGSTKRQTFCVNEYIYVVILEKSLIFSTDDTFDI